MLDPSGRFECGHYNNGVEMNVDGFLIPSFKAGNFVCSLVTEVAIIVIKELSQARYKRTQLAHVLGVLRLLRSKWRRHIYKSEDLIIDIPAGCGEICPREMHETLILVIHFPYLNRCPWGLRNTNILVGMYRYLQSLFKANYRMGGCVLSQLCKQMRGMDTLTFGHLLKLLPRGANPSLLSQ